MKTIHHMMSIALMASMTALSTGCRIDNRPFALSATDQPLLTAAQQDQVNKLYESMSLEERVAQLRSINLWEVQDQQGHLDTTLCRKLMANGIGHFAQFASQSSVPLEELRDQVAEAQQWLRQNTPHGIPALFHEEVITGVTARDATV